MTSTVACTDLRLISFPELARKGITYHRTWILKLEKAGQFPKRIRLSATRVGWLEHEIDEWIRSKPRGPAPDHPLARLGRRQAPKSAQQYKAQ